MEHCFFHGNTRYYAVSIIFSCKKTACSGFPNTCPCNTKKPKKATLSLKIKGFEF